MDELERTLKACNLGEALWMSKHNITEKLQSCLCSLCKSGKALLLSPFESDMTAIDGILLLKMGPAV